MSCGRRLPRHAHTHLPVPPGGRVRAPANAPTALPLIGRLRSLVLVMDASGSVGSINWDKMKTSAPIARGPAPIRQSAGGPQVRQVCGRAVQVRAGVR